MIEEEIKDMRDIVRYITIFNPKKIESFVRSYNGWNGENKKHYSDEELAEKLTKIGASNNSEVYFYGGKGEHISHKTLKAHKTTPTRKTLKKTVRRS